MKKVIPLSMCSLFFVNTSVFSETLLFPDFKWEGSYVICVNENKDYRFLKNRYDGHKYLDYKWRWFETAKKTPKLFFPEDGYDYWQGTWVMPVEKKKYTKLQANCNKQFGEGYFPQPYSKYGWFPFVIGSPKTDKTYKEPGLVQKGYVTPYWWTAGAWYPGYSWVDLYTPGSDTSDEGNESAKETE